MFPKACPRCHGDVYTQTASNPVEMTCLQCGRTLLPEQAAALWAARKERVKAA